MKLKRLDLNNFNQFLGALRLEGLELKTKLNILNIKLQVSSLLVELIDMRNKAEADLVGIERYKELISKVSTELTDDEIKELDTLKPELNQKLAEQLQGYLNETVSIEFEPLSEAEYNVIVEKNNMDNVAEYEYLYNTMVSAN